MFVITEIDEAEAAAHLAKNPRPLSRKRKIIKTELLYLPCYLYSLTVVRSNKIRASEKVCIDGIQGQFAFFSQVKFSEQPLYAGRIYDFVISEAEARELALEEYKRFLLKHSLKKKISAVVESIEFEKKIYYPFWIGYFKRKGALDFEVIDGISAKKQGVKMRPVFIQSLLQQK